VCVLHFYLVRNVQKTPCLPVNVGMRFLHNSVVELKKDTLLGCPFVSFYVSYFETINPSLMSLLLAVKSMTDRLRHH
jgi:hypothetical protein